MDCFEAYEQEIKRNNDRSDEIDNYIRELESLNNWPEKWALGMRIYNSGHRYKNTDNFSSFQKDLINHPDKKRSFEIQDRFIASSTRLLDSIFSWSKLNPIMHSHRDGCSLCSKKDG
jgi:hypothetical protein